MAMAMAMAMRIAVFLLLVIVTLECVKGASDSTTSKAEASGAEGVVLDLDASNFSQIVGEHPFIVVEFYAPWCGHCKRLAPEYEKAAEFLRSNDPPIVLARVDASDEKNKALAAQYQISGFPTLKIIENKGERVRDYKGPRDAAGIVAFLKKQVGPVSEELISADQVAHVLEKGDVVIVGVFEQYEGEEFLNFTKAAESLKSDYEFLHTSDLSLLPSRSVALVAPVVRLFKTFDEGFNDIKDFSVEALKNFFVEASFPLVSELSRDPAKAASLNKFFSCPESKVYLFAKFNDSEANTYREEYEKLAQSAKGKGLRFLIANAEEVENAIQHFGVSKEGIPAIVVQDTLNKKFVLENVKPSELGAWLQNYLDGNVEEHVKSEPIPESNDEPVKVVVRKSFNDFMTSGKNVLIEFYAPSCGHCKKLAPVYEEVAEYFEDDPEIIVAKMDATANDIPTGLFDVSGFPTIYFHSASGVTTNYDGDRSKDDLIKFVKKHRSTTVQEARALKDEL